MSEDKEKYEIPRDPDYQEAYIKEHHVLVNLRPASAIGAGNKRWKKDEPGRDGR